MLTAGPTVRLLGAADPAHTLSPGGRAATVEDVQRSPDRSSNSSSTSTRRTTVAQRRTGARRATSHLLLVQAVFFQSEV
ncbi:hypothetical protein GCM10010346_63500 [Streptomyces chryseus]|uniref:Uncharacterized protein n=1 Tax=Streptomyces chryseus TaxID=68186 RepID=A0ABQ3EDL7_9ACTN|nr:hypothetical protein GCM10010346_63500 [Streptomyces chryseus]